MSKSCTQSLFDKSVGNLSSCISESGWFSIEGLRFEKTLSNHRKMLESKISSIVLLKVEMIQANRKKKMYFWSIKLLLILVYFKLFEQIHLNKKTKLRAVMYNGMLYVKYISLIKWKQIR